MLPPRTTTAVLALLAALPALVGLGTASATASVEQIESVPVTFSVVNQNRSAVSCPSDGKKYEVTGHLTGPAAALRNDTVEAATLYLHGDAVDERLWRYTKNPAYNHVATLAAKGFVSFTVTRLGYQGSGTPNGNNVCIGSEADVAHQIVEQLRDGEYESEGASPKVGRLALAGHSLSGFVAMAAAYSFGDVDALAVVASGAFATPRAPQAIAGMQARCASNRDGYALLETDDEQAAMDFFHDGEPAIVEDVIATRPKDACGGPASAPASMAADAVMLGTIKVPVLSIAGAEDAFFPNPEAQAKLFTGSKAVKAVKLADTGHAITLERTAPAFHAAMASWLDEHGFAAR